jgi:hypothetical protein
MNPLSMQKGDFFLSFFKIGHKKTCNEIAGLLLLIFYKSKLYRISG